MHYTKQEQARQSCYSDMSAQEEPSMQTLDTEEETAGPHGIQKMYEGVSSRVVHCEGAFESLSIALASVPKKNGPALIRSIIMQIQRLISGERMSKENFPQEGPLPRTVGKDRERSFYAFKKIPIRAYCWSSDRYPKTWFISHYIYKGKDKLDAKDTTIVGKNWNRIEVDGDES